MNATGWARKRGRPGNKTTMWLHRSPRTPRWPHQLASVRKHRLSQWMSVTAPLIADDMEHNAPTRRRSNGSWIQQPWSRDLSKLSSALWVNVFHTPPLTLQPSQYAAHACACEQTRLYVMPCPTMSRLQPVCVSSHAKTIFFLINHANNTKQLWSESSCEA